MMGRTTTAADTATDKKTEEALDRELEESFPASDPPNVTRVPSDEQFTSDEDKSRGKKTSNG